MQPIDYAYYLDIVQRWEEDDTCHLLFTLYHKADAVRLANFLRNNGYYAFITGHFYGMWTIEVVRHETN